MRREAKTLGVDRNRIERALKDLDGERALRSLLERELGYEGEHGLISTDGWREELTVSLSDDEPELFASAGREGRFAVIRMRLASSGKLSLMAERRLMERLRDRYPYALYVFSDAEERLWHFVNAPHVERAGGKQYRRIVVGPGEGLRTATDRISLLSIDDLAEKEGKEPEELSPLEIQAAHDAAFDVEAVTREFFREYRRVFEAVESRVTGLEGEERIRFFVQRLFNRLMFVAFVEKKGWMRLNGRTEYLPALWETYAAEGGREGFYRSRVRPLFFRGFNTENEVGHEDPVIGTVPYLNGGLFEADADDTDENIDVPDSCLREILIGLFGRFNFTTTESTPLDVEVAVDPEMLGKVFEELITGRHDVGAYYTPKPIVSFMCREALKGYLEEKLEATSDEEKEAIRAFVEDHDPAELPDPEGALEALRSVRVCDPACGSGAYLLGMLRELLDLRESLFAARNIDPRTGYQRKLEIIQKNLYGVDIDEFAVNIARLRLWLSLVVDYEGQNPPPLPNLEFKIEVGDSLTGPNPSGALQAPDMFRDSQIEEYFNLKSEYLKAHGDRKAELRRQIERLREDIAEWAHPGETAAGFDWEVEFAEVFAEGGFDVVVANPPYVRQELITALKPKLKEVFPDIYSGYADLYVYFYGRAVQLLRKGGMLAFISPSKWFRADYGSKLREWVARGCHVRSITDFGDLPVFQSATAYAMIFTAQKMRGRDEPTSFIEVESLAPPYPNVTALIRRSAEHLPPEAIDGDDWLLTDATTASRLATMRAYGVPLGEYASGRIYRGVVTGFNDAFVIDSAQREALISQDARSEEIIKRFVVGRDVRKWTIDYRDRWLLFTRRGIDIDAYPAIKRYLEQWRENLEPKPRGWPSGKEWPGRKAGSYKWYEIQDEVAYHAEFDKPKIIYPVMVKSSRFAFESEGSFANDKAFIIPLSDFYLLGVLNSVPAWTYITEKCSKLRGGFYELRSTHLSKVPIPKASEADRESVAALVRKCLDTHDASCGEWEQEIDERVAFLYGLSAEDLEDMIAELRSREGSAA
jgi:hypothetical protein